MKITFLISLVLMGCATTYQPQGSSGGFSEMKLNKDLFQVSFAGNGFTGAQRVQKYFLRRCAEITIENGFDYFALIDQETGASKHSLGSTHTGTVTPNYYGGYNYAGNSHESSVTKHDRSGTIKLFKEGTQPEVAINAKEILQNTTD